MLRLPPSLITLSAVELQDFCLRRKAKLLAAQPNKSLQTGNQSCGIKKLDQYHPAQVASENLVTDSGVPHEPLEFPYGNSSTEYFSGATDSSHDVYYLPHEPADSVDSQMQDVSAGPAATGSLPRIGSRDSAIGRHSAHTGRNREVHGIPGHDHRYGFARRPCSDDSQLLNSNSSIDQENEPEFLPVSQDSTEDIDYTGEREQQSHHASSSPSKHRFDYGGFVESLPHDLSSFMPDDISTPAPPTQNDVQRLRARLPLPRSPLHMSELVAKSPERRNEDNLASGVSSSRSPGHLPPRRTPKAYRPRTISYSYDESERTSAVYEEPQANVFDNDGEQMSLHEELGGRSLHSTSERSDIPSSPPEGVIIHNHEANRTLYFSSPQLPGDLPPPFSTVPRRTSFAASLPSTASQEGYKSDESSELVEYSPSPSPPRRSNAPESSNQSIHRSGGPLHRIGRMFSGRYRERSPINPPESFAAGTASSPTTPRQSIENPSRLSQTSNATPRRSVRVYDDSLPPSSQPQTPAHLPESRHRSRLHPSYTAPVIRHGRRTLNPSPQASARFAGSARSIRRTVGRSHSPLGMGNERGEGFRGLYGGQENIDDDVLFENAARRLWDTGRARSAERRGSDGTPERELTLADIRREYQ